jgi:hypothetical protein
MWGEGGHELACPWIANAERPSFDASVSADRNVHYWPDVGEESPVCQDVGHCPPPCWGGWGAHRALGSSIIYHGAGAWALA